jgi:Rrf2 family protein
MADWSAEMRLEITRKSDLAVRALCVLDARGQTKGADLAAAVGSSQGFIAQAMTPLVQAGWVGSDPGPNGGYRLQTALSQLSMLEVIEAIEGPTVNGECVLSGGPCPAQETCALHDAWVPARDALLERLAATTVAEATGCLAPPAS